MNRNFSDTIESILTCYGMVQVGFGDVSNYDAEFWTYIDQENRLPIAISFSYPLDNSVMNEVADISRPTHEYAEVYNLANDAIDRAVLALANYIRAMGYKAIPVPASERVDDKNLAGLFSHKAAATRAGIGWIGKTDLLVTRKYGPRVRLGTVLTDMPLQTNVPIEKSLCGKCNICVTACPAQAANGVSWIAGMEREDFFSAPKCDDYKMKYFYEYNEGRNCAICVAVCPFGKKNL